MPRPDVTLRPYRNDDLDTVVELWHRSWSAAFPDLQHPLAKPEWKPRFADEIVRRSQVWIAEIGGEIVGFLAVEPDAGYIDQLFIDPAAQRGGIGSALMAKAKALCPARIMLHALQQNPAALRFYEKHGFTAGATTVNPVNGQPAVEYTWTA